MTRVKNEPSEADLRLKAEDRLRQGVLPAEAGESESDLYRLVHELQVHQVELEMQNEELRDARDELEHVAQKYEDLYDFAPVGYVTFDPQGVIRGINLTGANLFGVERSRLLNRRLDSFVPIAYQPAFATLLDGVFRKHAKEIIEFYIAGLSDPPVYVRLEAVPTGMNPLCRAAISDISELRRVQDERTRLEAELRQAQKMEAMGTLVGGIAHDFNNILTPIMAYADLALVKLAPDSEVHQDICQVLLAAERAKELVGWLLAAGRDRSSSPAVLVDLAAVIQETVQLARPTIPPMIRVGVDVAAGCGSVLGAPVNLQRVLLNLLANARDSMEGGGGTIQVVLRSVGGEDLPAQQLGGVRQGSWLVLSVVDTGVGMNSGVLERAFDPYFSTKGHGKGCGLGLAVAYGLVASMGGEILVQSSPGKGASFDVLLPETQASATHKNMEIKQLDRGAGQHVLLVEDDDAIREVVERMLMFLGYQVTACASGEAALQAARADPHKIDVVLTDYSMPGMSGLVLAGELKILHSGLPVVMGTGYAETIDTSTIQAFGLSDIILKPYSLQRLSDVVWRALTQHSVADGAGGKPPGAHA